jgi:AsmA protein
VTFFPKLGLDSGKASLSQRNSAKEFASINNARFYVAWWPLFRKQLVLERVEIDGMHANLTRFKDGTTNYDDLLLRNEALPAVTLDIDGVRITNSSILLQDEIEWKRVALQELKIETGRLADTVPGNLSASFQLNSEKLRSDAHIDLNSRLFFDRAAGRYEFADIEGKLQGVVAGFSNLDLRFGGSVDGHTAPQSVLAENIVVAGTGNYGQRGIEARLNLPRLQLDQGSLRGTQLNIDATLSQFNDSWTAAIQLPSFAYTKRIFDAEELGADFDFKGDGRMLRGKLSTPVSVDLTAAPRLQLSRIALNFSAAHPVLARELAAIATGNLHADFAEQNANIGFKGRVDDSDFTGSLALKDLSHPRYNFAFSTTRLDLDRYISAEWIKRYQNDAMQLDFGGIKKLSLNGHLHADEFMAAKLKATRLEADIRIEQDTLTIAPLTARLYGGTLASSLSVAAQAVPQIALRQNLRGIQVKALLADTASAGRLSGKGDVVMEFGAEGGTVGALRKSLSGSASLALVRGTLTGIDLRSALLEGKDVIGTQGQPRVHPMKPDASSAFSELKAQLNFPGGNPSQGQPNSFEMKSPLFRVNGTGEFVPDTGNLTYQLNAIVANTLSRRSAGELAELKGVTVPLRVSGTWATPTFALDFAAASGDLVTKRIAAKAAAEQAATKAAEKQAAAEAAAKAKAAKSAGRAGKTIKK